MKPPDRLVRRLPVAPGTMLSWNHHGYRYDTRRGHCLTASGGQASMDDDSKRTNGGATTGDAPEQQEKASGHGSQVNGAASTAEDAAGDVSSENATTDASKKRSQPFGSRLSFGQKQKSEPKTRTVDEVRVADGALASIIGL